MRATNIKYLLRLKKTGIAIKFFDCPQCKRFFGTNEPDVETCCLDCDVKYALRRQEVEAERQRRLAILKTKKYLMN